METFSRFYDRLLEVIAVALIIGVTAIVVRGFTYRWAGQSLVWYDEVASISLAWAALCAGIVDAATVENLYTVTVVPDPAATDQRRSATQAAMARLLIRVTGSRNAPPATNSAARSRKRSRSRPREPVMYRMTAARGPVTDRRTN